MHWETLVLTLLMDGHWINKIWGSKYGPLNLSISFGDMYLTTNTSKTRDITRQTVTSDRSKRKNSSTRRKRQFLGILLSSRRRRMENTWSHLKNKHLPDWVPALWNLAVFALHGGYCRSDCNWSRQTVGRTHGVMGIGFILYLGTIGPIRGEDPAGLCPIPH